VLFEKSRWGLVFSSKVYFFLIYFKLKTSNKHHLNIKKKKKPIYQPQKTQNTQNQTGIKFLSQPKQLFQVR
jgi:hypothetical protein